MLTTIHSTWSSVPLVSIIKIANLIIQALVGEYPCTYIVLHETFVYVLREYFCLWGKKMYLNGNAF